jgi:protease I
MSTNDLRGLRVAILATNGFEQAELEEPRRALDHAGATTTVVSPSAGTIQGMKHDQKGGHVTVDLLLEEAAPEDFDAVLLPGGVVNADALRMNEKAREFVRAIDRNGKPIAVICHGPWLLISAGLVQGRHLTSYFTLQDDIRNAGGHWTDQETVLDGNWISSRKPEDIPAFNEGTLQLFGRKRMKAQVGGMP